VPNIVTDDQRKLAMQAREILATYREAEELINIGAYVRGSNPKIDDAIKKYPKLESFLIQDLNEADFSEDLWGNLRKIVEN